MNWKHRAMTASQRAVESAKKEKAWEERQELAKEAAARVKATKQLGKILGEKIRFNDNAWKLVKVDRTHPIREFTHDGTVFRYAYRYGAGRRGAWDYGFEIKQGDRWRPVDSLAEIGRILLETEGDSLSAREGLIEIAKELDN